MDELPREMIEQFGMSGAFAEEAEIVHRGNDAATEKMMPHAIYENPGDQGVRGSGELPCEFRASARLCRRDARETECLGQPAWCDVPGTRRFSANEDVLVYTGAVGP